MVGSTLSELTDLKVGSPQGSLLSPTIFQAFFWPFQKNSSPKKLKDSKKTQANFPKTQGSANSEDRIPPNFRTIL